jgi:hypothetical protein
VLFIRQGFSREWTLHCSILIAYPRCQTIRERRSTAYHVASNLSQYIFYAVITGAQCRRNQPLQGGTYVVTYNVLIMGASYGSLLAIKLLFSGHRVNLICLPVEVEAINSDGIRVRLPVKGRGERIELDSRRLPGTLSASGPDDVNPHDYDLVVLAMQEPQYQAPNVRRLLGEIGKARKPCMSIMNMPPLPYLKRIPRLSTDALASCYTDAGVWQNIEPALMTLCSPDPQAFRPLGEKINVLEVTLPTNFKAARFASNNHTAILLQMQAEIDAIRYDTGTDKIELPVKLKVHDSIFVPLAKWAMLVTGNYRCVQKDEARSIKDAVHSDIEASRRLYEWVCGVCTTLGAAQNDMVPFAKYANAARELTRPSSAARALFSGARNIERVDRLMQLIAKQQGTSNAVLDETVALVDQRLAANRSTAG